MKNGRLTAITLDSDNAEKRKTDVNRICISKNLLGLCNSPRKGGLLTYKKVATL